MSVTSHVNDKTTYLIHIFVIVVLIVILLTDKMGTTWLNIAPLHCPSTVECPLRQLLYAAANIEFDSECPTTTRCVTVWECTELQREVQ